MPRKSQRQLRTTNRTQCDGARISEPKGTSRAFCGFTRESYPTRLEMDVTTSSSWVVTVETG
eukprot:803251-Prorocentrum_lima.AAC.1